MDAIDSELSNWWMEAVSEVSARSDNVYLSFIVFIVRPIHGLDRLERPLQAIGASRGNFFMNRFCAR